MYRLLTLAMAALVLAGCRGQSPPASDPFLGRVRVAPPGTGSVSAGPADPYYRGPPNVAMPPASSPTLAPPNVSQGVPSAAPPGSGDGFRGSSVPAIRIPNPSPPESRAPSAEFASATLGGTPGNSTAAPREKSQPPAAHGRVSVTAATGPLAGRPRVIRILPPRPKPGPGTPRTPDRHAAVDAEPPEPRRLNVPTRAIDIRDLPKSGTTAGRIASAPGDGPAAESGGFRPVSGTQPSGDSSVVRAAVGTSEVAGGTNPGQFGPRTNYGQDPDYAWVRGRLEYSEIDRRWKLRYIPVDGETDEYGGSMVLSDPALLAGCERGDFVEIRGSVAEQDPKRGFAPTYQVAEVKRLK